MARAPYSPETLARIRSLAAGCQGVHAVCAIIEWPAEDLRRMCRKHQIVLIEDVLAKPATIAKAPVASRPSPGKAHPASSAIVHDRLGREKPNRVSKFKIKRDALASCPRHIACSIMLSDKAHAALYELGKQHGKTAGSVLAVSIDYAARYGWAEELFIAAIAEIEAQP